MDNAIKRLENLIEEKVQEGLFPSVEDAVASISRWLDELDKRYLTEEMHNEDA
jgi:hypothetical protein